jgi:hypothetical protein
MTVDLLLLQRIAQARAVEPRLLQAVMLQESGGKPFAYRPEPHFRYFVDCRTGRPFREVSPDELASKIAPPDFPTLAGCREQEWWGQQASWGPLQVMGAVAREQGFRGPYLVELCDPETNLTIGAQLLHEALAWANGDESVALGSYNAGRGGARSEAGQRYARSVLTLRARLA